MQIMRKAFLLFLSLSVVFTACDSPGKKQKKVRPEKEIPVYAIGLNLPLSGNGSYFAEEFKKGFDLAMEHIAASPERIVINSIYEDNKLNPKDAVSITKKFIEIDEVDVILCGYTPLIQATIGMAEQAQVPMLVTLSSSQDIAAGYHWAFRDFNTEAEIMPLLANYAFKEMGLDKASYLVVNDDMGEDAVKFFEKQFTELGGRMYDGEVFASSETDLRNKISKIMEDDPQLLIVMGRGSAMINACRQIRERHPDIPIFGNNTMDNDVFWEGIGNEAGDFYFPRHSIDHSGKRYLQANTAFRERYGYDLNHFNIYGLSIGNYLARGLEQSGGLQEKMRDFMKNLDIESVRGRLQMSEKHDVLARSVVVRRSKGLDEVVWDPEASENEIVE